AATAVRQVPPASIDARNVAEIVTDEESLGGRDRRAEIVDRRFVVERFGAQPYQRPLARQHIQDGGGLLRRSGGRRDGRLGLRLDGENVRLAQGGADGGAASARGRFGQAMLCTHRPFPPCAF